MRDPLTVAWEVKGLPRKSGLGGTWRPPVVTVWHRDPEKDGTDDSCDWWGRYRPLSPKEKAIVDATWKLERVLCNRPFYPDHEGYHRFKELQDAIREWRKRPRWRLHPRWHFWHWRIQVVPLQDLKRWAFSRCCVCGGRFKYGESPLSHSWSGTGPRWFRGEAKVLHGRCDNATKEPNGKE
jgi:hypothetical protein